MAGASAGYWERVGGARPWRLPLALLAAIAAAWLTALPAAALATLVMAGVASLTLDGLEEVMAAWMASWVLLPVAAVLSVAGALPTHLLLAAVGRQGFAAYALAGAVAGLLVMRLDGGLALPAVVALCCGAAAGLGFRAVFREADDSD